MLAWSLAQKVTYNGASVTPLVNVHMRHGLPVDQAREELAEEALGAAPDYLLWLDADHTFPPDTMFRLMGHDLPFVGCNYRRRAEDGKYPSALNIEANGSLSYVEPKASGLQPVSIIGFGVCLIKGGVFRSLPKPWFTGGNLGEDTQFCQRARAHGIQPYVDHSLSMEVGHIAETVLTFPR
jgi:hypothetical protein